MMRFIFFVWVAGLAFTVCASQHYAPIFGSDARPQARIPVYNGPQQLCKICTENYDRQHIRIQTTCHADHELCHKCALKLAKPECPFCRAPLVLTAPSKVQLIRARDAAGGELLQELTMLLGRESDPRYVTQCQRVQERNNAQRAIYRRQQAERRREQADEARRARGGMSLERKTSLLVLGLIGLTALLDAILARINKKEHPSSLVLQLSDARKPLERPRALTRSANPKQELIVR